MCEAGKNATDVACESRESLFYMPNREEENPLLWINLLSLNEHFEGKRNNKRVFFVSLFFVCSLSSCVLKSFCLYFNFSKLKLTLHGYR